MFEMPTIEKAKIKSNITSYWSTLDKQISSLSFCLKRGQKYKDGTHFKLLQSCEHFIYTV